MHRSKQKRGQLSQFHQVLLWRRYEKYAPNDKAPLDRTFENTWTDTEEMQLQRMARIFHSCMFRSVSRESGGCVRDIALRDDWSSRGHQSYWDHASLSRQWRMQRKTIVKSRLSSTKQKHRLETQEVAKVQTVHIYFIQQKDDGDAGRQPALWKILPVHQRARVRAPFQSQQRQTFLPKIKLGGDSSLGLTDCAGKLTHLQCDPSEIKPCCELTFKSPEHRSVLKIREHVNNSLEIIWMLSFFKYIS